MVTQQSFYGNSSTVSFGSNRQLAARMPRLQVLTATGAGLNVNLGDSRDYKIGGPHFFIVNVGANTFTVVDNGGTTLATLTTNQVCEISLLRNTGANGVWFAKVSNVGFSDASAAAYYHYFSGGEYYTSQFVLVLNRTTEYNQVTDVHTQKTNSTLSGKNGASFTYGATLHQTGGTSSGTGHVQYDPDAWTAQTSLSAGHEDHTGCELTSNVGVVFGGSTSGGAGTSATRTRTDTFASGAWTSRTVRPGTSGSNESPCAPISNIAYLLASYQGMETSSYAIDTWISLTSRGVPARAGQGGVSDGTDGFLFGGSDFAGGADYFAEVWKYSVSGDAWISRTALPVGRSKASASYISPYAMIFGGYTDSDFLRGTAYRYDPTMDTTTRMTDINYWGWVEGQCHAQPVLR